MLWVVRLHVTILYTETKLPARRSVFLIDENELSVLELVSFELVYQIVEPLKLLSILALADVLHRRVDNKHLGQGSADLHRQSMHGDREAALEERFLSAA